MSIYFGIILCTRIPLCHKFHELVDCIKTKLKIVTSMQFKLCTASWLEWGGGALSTKVFTGVCRKHGLQNQDGQVCRVPFLCKIWYQTLQNLYQKSINFHKNCDICIIWVKIGAIGIWMGPLLMGGTKIPCSTSLSRPNLSSQANPSCYQAFHKLVKIQESCTASILFS